jgi:hypothetical protein
MKKFLRYALLLLFVCSSIVLSSKESPAISISGKVLYDTVLTPAASGYVKAFKLNTLNYNLTQVDSASVGAGGTYTLANITAGDTLYLIAYPVDLLGYVPCYYPGSPNWLTGSTIIASSSQTNIDIKVRKLYNASFIGKITGTVSYNNGLPLKNALMYLKTLTGVMISFAVTDENGFYSIPNVGEGEYQVTANRVGFNNNNVFGIIMDYNFYTTLPNQNFSLQQTVSISQISSSVPSKYNLHQNYPNPFNPVTKIKFDVQKSGNAKINVYNMQGKLVKAIVNQFVPAGSFEAVFDGKDLSSGIYYYRMEIAGFLQTKKMTLVK